MRKILGAGLFVAAALFLVLGLTAFLPKYSGFLRIFFVFLLLDAGLWLAVSRFLTGFIRPVRIMITFLYWLPLAIAGMAMATGLFIPFLVWPIAFRTYLQSILLCLFLMKLPPITAWILTMLFRLIPLTIQRFHSAHVSMKSFYRPGIFIQLGWITGFMVFIALIAGMIFGQFAFTVRQHEVALKNLPVSFNGFRIVQFSDVHLGSWTCKKKLAEAVDSINLLTPDVIFFTGDMFNYRTDEGRDFGEILSKLVAPNGIFAILGNHDYGDYISWPSQGAKQQNMTDLQVWYKRLGWKLLLNSNTTIRKGDDSIAIIGVENWGATYRFQRIGDISKAQEGVEGMPVKLLLSHDPSYWDSIVSKQFKDIDITFSGHTHGGQVGIETSRFSWSPASLAYPHWQGLYQIKHASGDQYLYVNQGLGNIGYAGRIGILPEITLLILKQKE